MTRQILPQTLEYFKLQTCITINQKVDDVLSETCTLQ